METNVFVENLLKLYREHQFAHAYLVETNNISKCFEDIIRVVKGISCTHGKTDYCDECNICHLIDQQSLPSLIVIEPDGKNIKKDAIDHLKHSFSTKPVYTDNNIYIIKYPEKMNDTAFNKMLKFLEEPEDHILGFYITENKDNVANTIVSRCETIKMMYQGNTSSAKLNISDEEYTRLNEYAKKTYELICNCDKSIVWYNNFVLTKELDNRIDITNYLKILLSIFMAEINEKDFAASKIIEKYLDELNFNVNTSLLLDSLVLEVGVIYEK